MSAFLNGADKGPSNPLRSVHGRLDVDRSMFQASPALITHTSTDKQIGPADIEAECSWSVEGKWSHGLRDCRANDRTRSLHLKRDRVLSPPPHSPAAPLTSLISVIIFRLPGRPHLQDPRSSPRDGQKVLFHPHEPLESNGQ